MSESLQTSSVTWVWKPDADNSEWAAQIAQTFSQIFPGIFLKSNEWKLEIHTDGFGRPYAMLEITLPPLSSIDETEKSGSLYYARKTLSGLSDHLKGPSIPDAHACPICDPDGGCIGACYGC